MGSWRSPATASVLRATFLSPSIADIAIAFTSTDEPIWTGLDVTGGWPAAILGLGYGCATASAVRSVARSTRHVLVYVLAVAHRLGARGRRGRAVDAPGAGPVAAGAPILFGFVVRARTPRPGPRFLATA